MKKRGLFLVVAFAFSVLILSKFAVAVDSSILPEIDRIIKDNNNNIYAGINNILSDKLKGFTSQEDLIKTTIENTLKFYLIKIALSVFFAVLFALLIYSWIRFLLRNREKEILDFTKKGENPLDEEKELILSATRVVIK